MGQRWRHTAVMAAGASILVVTGCSAAPADHSEIVTFTDKHGRACTATLVVDQEQNEGNDYEVSSLDCDYPPAGKTPGPTHYQPMPERHSN